MAVIKTEDLTYVYGEDTPFRKVAVDNVNLSIDEGEFIGVIGHTGSGKSTLIQHFNGLLKPSSGRIFIDGEQLWEDKARLREIRFKVGLVFQYPEYQLFEETCYKDIAFGPRNMGLSEEEIDRRVRETARLVGIDDAMLEKSPFELSGGQKRRVAIAGVMAMEPKVLILDEPASGLDPKGRSQILGLIREYHREKKNTVMLVSHSMEDVAKHCSKILVMNKAKVSMYDTPVNVFHRADELTAMGLSVPQVTKVFNRLKALGCDVPEDVYTVGFGSELIMKILSQHREADV